MDNKYTLGLDIGIGSIGWALVDVDNRNLIEFGSRIFDQATAAKDSRLNRGSRRNLRRKKWRKEQLVNAFVDFHLLTKEEVDQPGYFSFTTNTEKIRKPIDHTVYHLRKRALTEQVSKRELLLCLYNILQARGHFLMENVDFKKESITFDLFKDKFYALTEKYVNYYADKSEFEEKILKVIFEEKFKQKDLKTAYKALRIADEDSEAGLFEILQLICGFKAKIITISEDLAEDDKKVNVMTLKNSDEINDFLAGCVEIYDLIRIHQVLKDHDYICEIAVDLLEEQKTLEKNKDSEEYKQFASDVKNKMKTSKNHPDRLRVIKNIENNYPNGLYLKEVSAILHQQQEYYQDQGLTDNFIEVCEDIVAARIPYFIGPLSEQAKNSWIDKKADFKYSYAYSQKYLNAVNEEESIKRWKERMISRCAYLNEEKALPKGSFIGETFSIINELNIKTAKINNEAYYLSYDDKIKIFDELYLKKKEDIEFDEIRDLLKIDYFGNRNKEGKIKKMNNKYTLYHRIISALPELKIESISEIFKQSEKIDKIESIILDINLFDEEKSKKDYFESKYKYDSVTAVRLSKLTSSKFMSLSRKLIMDYPLNAEGESMMEMLFDDNTSLYTNEQMTLLTNATDKDGNKINLSANKYEKILKDNEGKLDINLLIDDTKPVIPISRPVIRALNECFKVYTQIIEFYGKPQRVVIETARDLKDSSIIKEVPAKHFDKMDSLHKYIKTGFAQNKKNIFMKYDMEEWDQLQAYANSNKQKIELYIRQNGHDLITDEVIDIHNLKNYEIDHILPRGFGDDSMDDKILISKKTNVKKGNRVPIEFLESQEGMEYIRSIKGGHYEIGAFKQRVEDLYSLGMISKKKRDRLLLETTTDVEMFVNRNLVDTRYIIRELMAILSCYNDYHGYDTHIVALKSAFTSMFRKAFYMNKSREFGCQHHAHDAAIIAVADRVLSEYYPNYDRHGNFKSYTRFIHELKEASGKEGTKEQKDKLSTFIRYVYRHAFEEDPLSEYSLIYKIKQAKPLYSLKVEKNYKGQLFDATLYKPLSQDKSVLGILKVNNEKRSFTSVNCVAVDFYKVTDSKGRKKHVAIHIPYAIINDKGEINQQKYKDLIRYHYKAKELLDENGNLNEHYFRFRTYRNDLIYDTHSKTVQIFNIGSIVNQKLDLKHIDIFSYNDIYRNANLYRRKIIKTFNLYNESDEKKIRFEDLDKEIVIDFTINVLMDVNDVERYNKSLFEQLNETKGLNDFVEKAAYLNLIVNRKNTPTTITGQYTPVINNNEIKTDPDAQYIKLKYSVLGVRFETQNNKLFIDGPNYHVNAYTKVKKEKFTWNLKNDMLE